MSKPSNVHKITVYPARSGYDSGNIECEGRLIGFKAVKDGGLFLTRCPECGLENYAMAVASGVCSWCGWSIHENATITDQ